MALATGLTKLDIAMIEIANLADGCIAHLADQADLTGGHAHLREVTFLGEQLCRAASRADHLTTAPLFDLDVVDHSTHRDIRNGKRVPRSNLGSCASHHRITNLEINRRHNVALLAIGIVQESEARCTVRVILDRRDFGGDITLIALEIDDADEAAMTAAAMTNGNPSIGVASTALAQWHEQGALRLGLGNFFKVMTGHPAGAGGYRFVFFNCHYDTPSKI